MKRIKLLDCTLRDGGYLNNWDFGEYDFRFTIDNLVKSGIDIAEIGFLRNEKTQKGRAVFGDIRDTSEYLEPYVEKKHPLFSLMAEQFNPYPIEKIPYKDQTNIDIVRVIIWKRLIPEAVEYLKGYSDKGYKVCVQPERVNQYTIDEFKSMIESFQKINPMGIYVVDSNGLLSKRKLLEYLRAADENMDSNIHLGYHGHNNLLETVGTAESFAEMNLDRNIIIDGSVLGMGRSSGNLPIELIAKYLNDNWDCNYGILELVDIYDKCIEKHYKNKQWGYSMQTFVTSALMANPNYADILTSEYGLQSGDIYRVVNAMNETDKVITNRDALKEYVSNLKIAQK